MKVIKDVCRLCLGTNDLLWMFDKKMGDNMTDIIKVTSGVEILKTDSVTQMVCGTCCQITLKMYKFRTNSMKNNADLKAQHAVYNISQLTSAHKKNDIVNQTKKESVIPESKKDVVVPESPQEDIVPESTNENVSPESREIEQEPAAATKPPLPPLPLVIKPIPDRYKNAHPSIKELIKTNPNLKIPRDCVNLHVGAYVTILANEVEDWYKERNYTYEEIAALKKEACEMASKKRKKTLKAEAGTLDPTPQKKVKFERKEMEYQSNRRKEIGEQAKAILATESTPEDAGPPSTTTINDSEEELVETPANESTSKDAREEPVETTSRESTSKEARKQQVDTPSKEKKKAPSKDKDLTKPTAFVFPDDDSKMFTTRPLLRKPQYRVCDVLLIDSDSEDEQPPCKATSTISDPIVLDVDSRSFFEDSDKALFTKALGLVPADSSNTSNMSLLSVANKTRTQYTRRGQRHTKCTFCSKRFKTLALRDDHVKNECGVNKSPIKLKIVKLELVRVDEDEEVRKKYPKAFEDWGDDVTPEISDMEDKNKEPKAPQRDSTLQSDTETEQVVLEIEKFLSNTENVALKGNAKKKKKNEDVICISNEEPESTTEKEGCRPKIKIVDSEILKGINLYTSDFELFKTILVNQSNIRATLGRKNYEAVAKNPILNGSTNRVTVFKKLRKHLQQFKIPIQVNYSQEVSVRYLPPKIRKLKKTPDLWSWMTPKDIKPVGSNARDLRGQTAPVLYEGDERQSVMPTSFSTNSLMCASSSSLVTTNASLVLNGSPSTSTSTPPIILNGTQAITINSGYPNFYLVQSALTTLPPPVIQSVRNEQPSTSMIASLESITTLMSMNQTSSSFVPVSQPNSSPFVPVTQSDNLFVPVSHTSNANVGQQGDSTDQSNFRQQPMIRAKARRKCPK